MSKFGKSFDERNKVTLAVTGIVVLTLLFLATFNADSLPVIGGGRQYTAEFAEAGGLKAGNEVRVAGVRVGRVSDISLQGDVVTVTFWAKGVTLGDQTHAAVKVKTLLGQKYLSVSPMGRGSIDEAIPRSRTTTPYDVTAAFGDLSSTVDEIDTAQMEKSFTALANAFRDTPASVQTTITGLTDLSRTISSRDEELAELLGATSKVTETFKNRNGELAALINDGSSLLGELESRRDTVKAMLDGTARLGTQLSGLVKDNQSTLRPALAKLDKVAVILQRNQANLDDALAQLGPYYRMLASATGNGKWVDSYICGLFGPDGAPVLENDVERNCAPKSGGGA